jgi:hypothetical protein
VCLAFHLVDVPKGECALADNAPRLVGVGVIADDLGKAEMKRRCPEEPQAMNRVFSLCSR